MRNSISISKTHISPHTRQEIITGVLLLVILAGGGFLRFYCLGEFGVGNTYYAAAVKSMLLSWRNFFYVAFEPGGSLSLDKPPLGFWVQAVSARFLGVTGFALALPNAIAGVLSIFVLYQLVRRPFGAWTGLIAALSLAITPVAISTERNNTVDGLLMFVLLLAAWAFLQSVYTGRFRWLLLGAFIVGLGFNIKMLQAFLPLPAFYAVYLFGAKQGWRKKILHLAVATVVLVIVSLSWAVAVELTPASARPYVDSTSRNSVMELIAVHNGVRRLTDLNDPVSFGVPGTWRLFTMPLVGQVSWLLPFALGGLLPLAVSLGRQKFGDPHLAFILWIGWLLPEMLYFTYSSGLMHIYYLIMLGAPLAALIGMIAWAFEKIIRERPLFGWGCFGFLMVATLVFQGMTVWIEYVRAIWALICGGFLCGIGFLLAAMGRSRALFVRAALTLVLAAIFITPATWSALTAFNSSPDGMRPYAGPNPNPVPSLVLADDVLCKNAAATRDDLVINGQALTNYLLANTGPGTYLLATDRESRAAAYILETGRPVLTFGGVFGQYDVVTEAQLAALVEKGELRFVLGENLEQYQSILHWVKQNCLVAGAPGAACATSSASTLPASLYDCKK